MPKIKITYKNKDSLRRKAEPKFWSMILFVAISVAGTSAFSHTLIKRNNAIFVKEKKGAANKAFGVRDTKILAELLLMKKGCLFQELA
jgi:hypothetical protein